MHLSVNDYYKKALPIIYKIVNDASADQIKVTTSLMGLPVLDCLNLDLKLVKFNSPEEDLCKFLIAIHSNDGPRIEVSRRVFINRMKKLHSYD